jgi:hypothetical protein
MHRRCHVALWAASFTLMTAVAQASPSQGGGDVTLAPSRAQTPAVIVPFKPLPWRPAVVVSGPNGLWISRDPVDGAPTAPPAAGGWLARPGVARIGGETPLRLERRPDGTINALLDDRWASFAVASRGAGGRPAWTCVPGSSGLEQFMMRPVVVAAPPSVQREER